MKAYIALFQSNLRLTLRDRTALFFNYLFPLLFFFAFAELFHAGVGGGIAFFVSTVLTMGILGNGLWGAGMRAVQDREANILRRYKVTPVTPTPMLVAAMVGGWLLYLPVLLLVLGLAHFLYGMPVPERWLSLVVMVSLGVFAFRAIGLMLAAVTNTMQEATIAIQLLYLPMLFLSGATFPAATLPGWAQVVAGFMPASYLVTGLQGIFFRGQTIVENGAAVAAMLLTTAMGTFLAAQLFRWEKGEKIRPRGKLYLVVVLAPFLLMGGWQVYTQEHRAENEALWRDLQRSGTVLIRNARVFTAAGPVIGRGAVLVRGGKIAGVWEGDAPEAAVSAADVVEGAGKTLLPGLIDAHVHLGAPGGLSTSNDDYDPERQMQRALAALLYSGVTAARSAGDQPDLALRLRQQVADGRRLGAQLLFWGPIFTADNGHGTEYYANLPGVMKDAVSRRMVRAPRTPEAARAEVRELKRRGVNGVKAIIEAGWGDGMLYDRVDLLLVRAVAEEARAQRLPVAIHTGDARDVDDAAEMGATSVEHGAWRDELPDPLLERMARQGVVLVPTLVVADAYAQYFSGKPAALDRSLVQQTVLARVIEGTRKHLAARAPDGAKAEMFRRALEQGRANLLRAWRAGVPLAAGTDAGNPLVFHGPALHRELALWVEAGIPAEAALGAATAGAARLLGVEGRTGAIRPGLDADLLLVDGNPLADITATERISLVMYKGERVRRAALFEQK